MTSTQSAATQTAPPLRVGCCAEVTDPAWHWLADDLGPPLAQWTVVLTRPRNVWERLIKRPALARYRACRELARGASAGKFDLIFTHLPLMTCWTEVFCRGRRRCPHVAFAFNFTDLPGGRRLALMRRAFRTVDQFIVFSSFERALYSEYFGIAENRIDVIPWRIRDPRAARASFGEEESLNAICAVGSQGRDYATLFEAMRLVPHIRLVVVAGAKNLAGLTPPPNVEIRQNIPLAEAEAVMRRSRFVIVPLRDDRTACGHVTIIYSMFQERAVVATNSRALAEYVVPGRTGVFVPPRDAQQLARTIEELWNKPDEAARLGAAGREFALVNCLESQTTAYIGRLIERLKTTGQP